jgi:hypothetical protein
MPLSKLAAGCLAAVMLMTCVGSSAGAATAAELKSLKERLSDKASDDQRVDNCHVPVDRRGPLPRPGCPGETTAPAPVPVAEQTDPKQREPR